MKVKVAVLLTLALFAFAVHSTMAFSLSAPKVCSASYSFIEHADPPAQPCGDPIEDEPHVPH